MDDRYRIYKALEDEIPAEDKARLDGYLQGRAELHARLEQAEMEVKRAQLWEEERLRQQHESSGS